MEDRNFRRRLLSSSQDPIHLPAGYKRLEYIGIGPNVNGNLSIATEKQPFVFTSKGYGPNFEIKIGHDKGKYMLNADSTGEMDISVNLRVGDSIYQTDRFGISYSDFTRANYYGNNIKKFKLNYDNNDTATIKCQDNIISVNGNSKILINDGGSDILKRDLYQRLINLGFDRFSLSLGGAICYYFRFYYCCYTDNNEKKYYIVPAYNPKDEWFDGYNYHHFCLFDTHGTVVCKYFIPDSSINYKFINNGGATPK